MCASHGTRGCAPSSPPPSGGRLRIRSWLRLASTNGSLSASLLLLLFCFMKPSTKLMSPGSPGIVSASGHAGISGGCVGQKRTVGAWRNCLAGAESLQPEGGAPVPHQLRHLRGSEIQLFCQFKLFQKEPLGSEPLRVAPRGTMTLRTLQPALVCSALSERMATMTAQPKHRARWMTQRSRRAIRPFRQARPSCRLAALSVPILGCDDTATSMIQQHTPCLIIAARHTSAG